MIHVKKSKIGQEKAKLWGVANRSTLSALHCTTLRRIKKDTEPSRPHKSAIS